MQNNTCPGVGRKPHSWGDQESSQWSGAVSQHPVRSEVSQEEKLYVDDEDSSILYEFARYEYDRRRVRENHLHRTYFGEAAWDILLDLYLQRAKNTSVSVTSACNATGVPATTALRWLHKLMSDGLILHTASNVDRRSSNVCLTELGVDKVKKCLTAQIAQMNVTYKKLRAEQT